MTQQNLKVLFLSSWYPNKENPTLGNFVEKHAEAVSIYAQVRVIYICFLDTQEANYEYINKINNNLEIHVIYLKKISTYLSFLKPISKLYRVIKAYKKGYQRIYNNEKPDIIHANVLIPIGLIAFYFKLTQQIPYIITEHWTGYLPQDNNKPGNSMFFYRFIANKAARLTPVTKNLAKALKNFNIRDNFEIVPNVVNVNLFKLKQTSDIAIKRIIHISSLDDEQKNFSGILFAISEIAKHRNDFLLEIISDGNFNQFKNKIERLNIADKIIFHGKKSTLEVAEIFQRSDFLLLFSNYENFPCVIAEAMSCGLAVLSTDVGGIAEHVNENNGILIEAHNIEMLISNLDFMITNCRNYNSVKIRKYAEDHFSYEVIGKQYVEIYQSVLNKQ